MDEDVRYKTDYPESSANRAQSAALGHALRVMASCRGYDETVRSTIRDLWPAIQLQQIVFLFNSKGAPVAFATWMHLSEDVAGALVDDPDYPLDLSERNEGDRLWITHVVAPFGHVRALVKKMKRSIPFGDGRVRGVKWNRARTRRRFKDLRVRWRRQTDDARKTTTETV